MIRPTIHPNGICLPRWIIAAQIPLREKGQEYAFDQPDTHQPRIGAGTEAGPGVASGERLPEQQDCAITRIVPLVTTATQGRQNNPQPGNDRNPQPQAAFTWTIDLSSGNEGVEQQRPEQVPAQRTSNAGDAPGERGWLNKDGR